MHPTFSLPTCVFKVWSYGWSPIVRLKPLACRTSLQPSSGLHQACKWSCTCHIFTSCEAHLSFPLLMGHQKGIPIWSKVSWVNPAPLVQRQVLQHLKKHKLFAGWEQHPGELVSQTVLQEPNALWTLNACRSSIGRDLCFKKKCSGSHLLKVLKVNPLAIVGLLRKYSWHSND